MADTAKSVPGSGLVAATEVASEAVLRTSANGLRYAAFADTGLEDVELARMVQTVPASMASALSGKSYFFVPLAMAEGRSVEAAGHRTGETTMISAAYTPELAEQAICHRNVELATGEGVFISSRLLNDRFSLAFEFFINVGHGFVNQAG